MNNNNWNNKYRKPTQKYIKRPTVNFDPHYQNDAVLKLEKRLVNKYSKRMMIFGMIFGIVVPPYIIYWKDQQMKVV